jgi:two-component system cell cycle sensor histidine kinase/response regulator CckA
MTPRHDDGPNAGGDQPRPPRTILLIEEDEAVRGLLQHLLEREGYTVLMAGDGPAGLALAEVHSGRIDLLVTEISMPRMSGREVADRTRALRQGLVVLFMSGYADSGTIRLGQENGREGLILKPFRPAELLGRVKEMLPDGAP